MNKFSELLKTNLDFIIKVIIILSLVYGFFYLTKPTTSLSYEDRKKLDSLNVRMFQLSEQQKKLDSSISLFEGEVEMILDSISKIKQEKIIIRKTYYEEINRVSNFTDGQVDSFFTNRYGFTPR